MALYLSRHGLTNWNKENRIQGRIEIPLNEDGVKQAEALREKIRDLNLSCIYVSPLLRARQTAEIARGDKDIPIIVDNRIIEEYYGDYEGLPRYEECYKKQREYFFKRYPNGEGYMDVVYRVYDFLHEMEAKHGNEDILVVAHGGMSRVVNSYFKDMNNEDFTSFMLDNCELARYEYPNRNFPLIQKPRD